MRARADLAELRVRRRQRLRHLLPQLLRACAACRRVLGPQPTHLDHVPPLSCRERAACLEAGKQASEQVSRSASERVCKLPLPEHVCNNHARASSSISSRSRSCAHVCTSWPWTGPGAISPRRCASRCELSSSLSTPGGPTSPRLSPPPPPLPRRLLAVARTTAQLGQRAQLKQLAPLRRG